MANNPTKSSSKNSSSSKSEKEQNSKFKPYSFDDFNKDFVEFGKEWIPGYKAYIGAISDPNYTLAQAGDDLSRDFVPFYNLYRNGDNSPADYALEAFLLGSPYARKFAKKFSEFSNKAKKYVVGDKPKNVSTINVTGNNFSAKAPTAMNTDLYEFSPEELAETNYNLGSFFDERAKVRNEAADDARKLYTMEKDLDVVNQKAKMLDDFEKATDGKYQVMVDPTGNRYYTMMDETPYRIYGEEVVPYDPRLGEAKLTPMSRDEMDEFIFNKDTKHLEPNPAYDPRMLRPELEERYNEAVAKFNKRVKDNSHLYDIDFYKNGSRISKLLEQLLDE